MSDGHHEDPVILQFDCDYCADGVPLKDGWHELLDEEGIEGVARVPCPNQIQKEITE